MMRFGVYLASVVLFSTIWQSVCTDESEFHYESIAIIDKTSIETRKLFEIGFKTFNLSKNRIDEFLSSFKINLPDFLLNDILKINWVLDSDDGLWIDTYYKNNENSSHFQMFLNMTGVYFKIFHESIDSELNQLTKEYETEISTPLLNFANSFEKKRKAQPFPNISEDCNAIDLSFIIEKLYKASCLQDIIKAKSKKEAAETHLENAQIRDVKDNNVEYEKFRILADAYASRIENSNMPDSEFLLNQLLVNYRPNATYSAINKYLQTSLNAPVTKCLLDELKVTDTEHPRKFGEAVKIIYSHINLAKMTAKLCRHDIQFSTDDIASRINKLSALLNTKINFEFRKDNYAAYKLSTVSLGFKMFSNNGIDFGVAGIEFFQKINFGLTENERSQRLVLMRNTDNEIASKSYIASAHDFFFQTSYARVVVVHVFNTIRLRGLDQSVRINSNSTQNKIKQILNTSCNATTLSTLEKIITALDMSFHTIVLVNDSEQSRIYYTMNNPVFKLKFFFYDIECNHSFNKYYALIIIC